MIFRLPEARDNPPEGAKLPGAGQLSSVLEDPIQRVCSLWEEARRNDHDLVGVLDVLHAESDQRPITTVLSSMGEWGAVKDQGDVAHALSCGMIFPRGGTNGC